MKQYVKRILDTHPYYCDTQRQKQFKIPKSSGDRRGLKTACRMAEKQKVLKEIHLHN
jgi:hypothetical protein